MGGADAGGVLRPHRVEGMEAVGVSAHRNWYEFHRDLRNELDDARFLSPSFGNPSRWPDRVACEPDISTGGVRDWNNPDLLGDLVVDVPAEDICKDLTLGASAMARRFAEDYSAWFLCLKAHQQLCGATTGKSGKIPIIF